MVKLSNKLRLIELSIVLLFAVILGALPDDTYMKIMFPILMGYLAIIILRRVFFVYEAYKSIKKDTKVVDLKKYPMVSVIVPCYNEAKVIARTIKNLKQLNYPNYEIIIVNDGSTDNTLSISSNFINKKVRVLTKNNGGKASALNAGILKSKGEYILCVDGDSNLHPNSIQNGLRHFKNPKVGAVAGFVTAVNQNNLLTQMQEFEYSIGLNIPRRALANYGIVPVIPGPIGLFSRDVLLEVNGFVENKNLMAEDTELTLRIIKAGYIIKSEPYMIAYTEVPEDIISLSRQRYRWNRGIMQALSMNFNSMMTSNYRAKILAAYLFFETYIVLYVNMAMVLSFIVHGLLHNNMLLLDKWFIGIIISELIVAAFISYNKYNKIKWLFISFISMFTYNSVLMFWRFFCLIDESLSAKMTWDKLERKG